MDIQEYQEKSKRTLNKDLNSTELLTNMGFGIAGEGGEVVDILKKHLFHGHDLDKLHLIEELGDVMFYIVNLCNVLNIDMGEVLYMNYSKLLKLYPEGFDSDASINRKNK